MSYVPQVGDRVRLPSWEPGAWALVEYVGTTRWLGTTNEGVEGVWWVDSEWEKPETPKVYPEGWMNVYSAGFAHPTRKASDLGQLGNRIGVLHLFPDGHTEMEAP